MQSGLVILALLIFFYTSIISSTFNSLQHHTYETFEFETFNSTTFPSSMASQNFQQLSTLSSPLQQCPIFGTLNPLTCTMCSFSNFDPTDHCRKPILGLVGAPNSIHPSYKSTLFPYDFYTGQHVILYVSDWYGINDDPFEFALKSISMYIPLIDMATSSSIVTRLNPVLHFEMPSTTGNDYALYIRPYGSTSDADWVEIIDGRIIINTPCTYIYKRISSPSTSLYQYKCTHFFHQCDPTTNLIDGLCMCSDAGYYGPSCDIQVQLTSSPLPNNNYFLSFDPNINSYYPEITITSTPPVNIIGYQLYVIDEATGTIIPDQPPIYTEILSPTPPVNIIGYQLYVIDEATGTIIPDQPPIYTEILSPVSSTTTFQPTFINLIATQLTSSSYGIVINFDNGYSGYVSPLKLFTQQMWIDIYCPDAISISFDTSGNYYCTCPQHYYGTQCQLRLQQVDLNTSLIPGIPRIVNIQLDSNNYENGQYKIYYENNEITQVTIDIVQSEVNMGTIEQTYNFQLIITFWDIFSNLNTNPEQSLTDVVLRYIPSHNTTIEYDISTFNIGTSCTALKTAITTIPTTAISCNNLQLYCPKNYYGSDCTTEFNIPTTNVQFGALITTTKPSNFGKLFLKSLHNYKTLTPSVTMQFKWVTSDTNIYYPNLNVQTTQNGIDYNGHYLLFCQLDSTIEPTNTNSLFVGYVYIEYDCNTITPGTTVFRPQCNIERTNWCNISYRTSTIPIAPPILAFPPCRCNPYYNNIDQKVFIGDFCDIEIIGVKSRHILQGDNLRFDLEVPINMQIARYITSGVFTQLNILFTRQSTPGSSRFSVPIDAIDFFTDSTRGSISISIPPMPADTYTIAFIQYNTQILPLPWTIRYTPSTIGNIHNIYNEPILDVLPSCYKNGRDETITTSLMTLEPIRRPILTQSYGNCVCMNGYYGPRCDIAFTITYIGINQDVQMEEYQIELISLQNIQYNIPNMEFALLQNGISIKTLKLFSNGLFIDNLYLPFLPRSISITYYELYIRFPDSFQQQHRFYRHIQHIGPSQIIGYNNINQLSVQKTCDVLTTFGLSPCDINTQYCTLDSIAPNHCINDCEDGFINGEGICNFYLYLNDIDSQPRIKIGMSKDTFSNIVKPDQIVNFRTTQLTDSGTTVDITLTGISGLVNSINYDPLTGIGTFRLPASTQPIIPISITITFTFTTTSTTTWSYTISTELVSICEYEYRIRNNLVQYQYHQTLLSAQPCYPDGTDITHPTTQCEGPNVVCKCKTAASIYDIHWYGDRCDFKIIPPTTDIYYNAPAWITIESFSPLPPYIKTPQTTYPVQLPFIENNINNPNNRLYYPLHFSIYPTNDNGILGSDRLTPNPSPPIYGEITSRIYIKDMYRNAGQDIDIKWNTKSDCTFTNILTDFPNCESYYTASCENRGMAKICHCTFSSGYKGLNCRHNVGSTPQLYPITTGYTDIQPYANLQQPFGTARPAILGFNLRLYVGNDIEDGGLYTYTVEYNSFANPIDPLDEIHIVRDLEAIVDSSRGNTLYIIVPTPNDIDIPWVRSFLSQPTITVQVYSKATLNLVETQIHVYNQGIQITKQGIEMTSLSDNRLCASDSNDFSTTKRLNLKDYAQLSIPYTIPLRHLPSTINKHICVCIDPYIDNVTGNIIMISGAHCQSAISIPPGPFYKGQIISYYILSNRSPTIYESAGIDIINDPIQIWKYDLSTSSFDITFTNNNIILDASTTINQFTIPLTILDTDLSIIGENDKIFHLSQKPRSNDIIPTRPQNNGYQYDIGFTPGFHIFTSCDWMKVMNHIYQCIPNNINNPLDPHGCQPHAIDKHYCQCKDGFFGPDCRIKVVINHKTQDSMASGIFMIGYPYSITFTLTTPIIQTDTRFNNIPWVININGVDIQSLVITTSGSSIDVVFDNTQYLTPIEITLSITGLDGDPNTYSWTNTIIYEQSAGVYNTPQLDYPINIVEDIIGTNIDCINAETDLYLNPHVLLQPSWKSTFVQCNCKSLYSFGIRCEYTMIFLHDYESIEIQSLPFSLRNYEIYQDQKLFLQLLFNEVGLPLTWTDIGSIILRSDDDIMTDITIPIDKTNPTKPFIIIPNTIQTNSIYTVSISLTTYPYTPNYDSLRTIGVPPFNFPLPNLQFIVVDELPLNSHDPLPLYTCTSLDFQQCYTSGTDLTVNTCSIYHQLDLTLIDQPCQCNESYYGDLCQFHITTNPSPLQFIVETTTFTFTMIIEYDIGYIYPTGHQLNGLSIADIFVSNDENGSIWELHPTDDFFNPNGVIPVTIIQDSINPNLFQFEFESLTTPPTLTLVYRNPKYFTQSIIFTNEQLTFLGLVSCSIYIGTPNECYAPNTDTCLSPVSPNNSHCICATGIPNRTIFGEKCDLDIVVIDTFDNEYELTAIIYDSHVKLKYIPSIIATYNPTLQPLYLHLYTMNPITSTITYQSTIGTLISSTTISTIDESIEFNFHLYATNTQDQFFFHISPLSIPDSTYIYDSTNRLTTPLFNLPSLPPLQLTGSTYIWSTTTDQNEVIMTNVQWIAPLRPQSFFGTEPLYLRFMIFIGDDNIPNVSNLTTQIDWTKSSGILQASFMNDSTNTKMIWVPEILSNINGGGIILYLPNYITIEANEKVMIIAQSSFSTPYIYNNVLSLEIYSIQESILIQNICDRKGFIANCNPFTATRTNCPQDQIPDDNFNCIPQPTLLTSPTSICSLQCPKLMTASGDCTECICITKTCSMFTRTFMLYFNPPLSNNDDPPETNYRLYIQNVMQYGFYKSILTPQLISILQLYTADIASLLPQSLHMNFIPNIQLPTTPKPFHPFIEHLFTYPITIRNGNYVPSTNQNTVNGIVCTITFLPTNINYSNNILVDSITLLETQMINRFNQIESILQQYFVLTTNNQQPTINNFIYNHFFAMNYTKWDKFPAILPSTQYIPRLIQFSLSPLPLPELSSSTLSIIPSSLSTILHVERHSGHFLQPYCRSLQAPYELGLCPSPTTVHTSKYWSKCDSILDVYCPDYNGIAINNVASTYCRRDIYPSYPKQISVQCSTLNINEPTLTDLTIDITSINFNSDHNNIYPGQFIPIKWIYNGPEHYTISIYIKSQDKTDFIQFITNVPAKPNAAIIRIPFTFPITLRAYIYIELTQNIFINTISSTIFYIPEYNHQCEYYDQFTGECICPFTTKFPSNVVNYESTQCILKQCTTNILQCENNSFPMISNPDTSECNPNNCYCDETLFFTGSLCNICSIPCDIIGTENQSDDCTQCICKKGYGGQFCQYRALMGSVRYKLTRPTSSSSISTYNQQQSTFNQHHHQFATQTLFNILSLPDGDSILPDSSAQYLISQLSISLDLHPTTITIRRVNTTSQVDIYQSNIINMNDNDNDNDITIQNNFIELQKAIPTTTKTTVVTFNIPSTTPSGSTNEDSLRQTGTTSIIDLYGKWTQLQKDYNNTTQIGTTSIPEISSPEFKPEITFDDAFDPICINTTTILCPIGPDPTIDPLIADSPRPKTSIGTILAVVFGVIGFLILFAIMTLLCWYAAREKKWCCALSEEEQQRRRREKLSTGGASIEISHATNLSTTDGESDAISNKPHDDGVSSQTQQSITTDLIPMELSPDEEPLEPGWARFKHKETNEIIYVNSTTMQSQRHKPGTTSNTKGRWF